MTSILIPFFRFSGEPTLKKKAKPPPTVLQAPQYSRYFVSRDQPVKLTWEAAHVCKIQISCNGEKFDAGEGRVCGKTCQGCKTRRKTRRISWFDFTKGNTTMKCRAKFWGIYSTKAEEITLRKACEYYVLPHVR